MTVVKTGPDGENSVKLGRNRWTLPTTTKPSKEKLGKKTNARAQPSSMNQLTIDRRLDASVCVASTNELHTWPCVCVCVLLIVNPPAKKKKQQGKNLKRRLAVFGKKGKTETSSSDASVHLRRTRMRENQETGFRCLTGF